MSGGWGGGDRRWEDPHGKVAGDSSGSGCGGGDSCGDSDSSTLEGRPQAPAGPGRGLPQLRLKCVCVHTSSLSVSNLGWSDRQSGPCSLGVPEAVSESRYGFVCL